MWAVIEIIRKFQVLKEEEKEDKERGSGRWAGLVDR